MMEHGVSGDEIVTLRTRVARLEAALAAERERANDLERRASGSELIAAEHRARGRYIVELETGIARANYLRERADQELAHRKDELASVLDTTNAWIERAHIAEAALAASTRASRRRWLR